MKSDTSAAARESAVSAETASASISGRFLAFVWVKSGDLVDVAP